MDGFSAHKSDRHIRHFHSRRGRTFDRRRRLRIDGARFKTANENLHNDRNVTRLVLPGIEKNVHPRVTGKIRGLNSSSFGRHMCGRKTRRTRMNARSWVAREKLSKRYPMIYTSCRFPADMNTPRTAEKPARQSRSLNGPITVSILREFAETRDGRVLYPMAIRNYSHCRTVRKLPLDCLTKSALNVSLLAS